MTVAVHSVENGNGHWTGHWAGSKVEDGENCEFGSEHGAGHLVGH